MDAVIYIHGQNGSASEAEHYKPLFENAHIFGVEYCGVTPWEAGEEIHISVADIASEYGIAVYLSLPFEVCYQRISGDKNRPIAASSTKEELEAMFGDRRAENQVFL